MFSQMPHYPAIKAAIWWSGIDYDEHGVADRICKLNEPDEAVKFFCDKLAPKPATKSLLNPAAK